MGLLDRDSGGRGISTEGGETSSPSGVGSSAPTRTTSGNDRPGTPTREVFDRSVSDIRDPIGARDAGGRGIIYDRFISPVREAIAPRDGNDLGVWRTLSEAPSLPNPNPTVPDAGTTGGGTGTTPVVQEAGSQTFAQFFDSLLRSNSGGNAKRDPAELLYVPSESGGTSSGGSIIPLLAIALLIGVGFWYYKKHHSGGS